MCPLTNHQKFECVERVLGQLGRASGGACTVKLTGPRRRFRARHNIHCQWRTCGVVELGITEAASLRIIPCSTERVRERDLPLRPKTTELQER